MMKFNEIPYQRPSYEVFEAEFETLLQKIETAKTFEEQNTAFIDVYKKRDRFDTMFQLANIKYTTDTADKTLEEEVNYFNTVSPKFKDLVNRFYAALNKSKFKKELQEKWGTHLLNIAEYAVKGFDPVIMDDMEEQNKLKTEYTKLKGTAKIDFDGKELNLAGIGKYLVDNDRNIRKTANEARWQFFVGKQAEFDGVFDKLVKVRHRMAQKMGHKNFIELGYNWMQRIDYNETMVENFRQQIVDEIVPITSQLRARQKNRLGYNTLEDHDLDFHFLSGNPKPKDSPKEILAKAKTMYTELSSDTEEFFNYMLKYNLLDVINRPGKADAGYCWCLSDYKHPFIFANFNGTSGDIDVLTHEAGHGFQYFRSRDYPVIEHRDPTSESAEIHAMSMEFLTYPWMQSFFKEDTEKYFFSHLNRSLLFLPYGCAVDHFQHIIYKNPDYTPDQRADVWKKMEALYLPDYKMDATPYLASGRFWHKQGHIFEMPFYYIDYVLAQICAFQFWQKANNNREEAWADYVRLCTAGGTQPFLELVKLANIKSPFEAGTVKSITTDIVKHLDSIDDTKF